MRVISGSLRGRIIKGHDIVGTRPTMDRVKESVFASIQDKIADSVVLDLFAGSGNLGIEAISNGCSFCYFVDCNPKCIKVIKENLKMFGISDKAQVIESDYNRVLKLFSNRGQVFDIIFIDPPYKEHILLELLETIRENKLLVTGGLIILEYNFDELEEVVGYEMIRKKRYGDKWVSIYKMLSEGI